MNLPVLEFLFSKPAVLSGYFRACRNTNLLCPRANRNVVPGRTFAAAKLAEVGKFEALKTEGSSYTSGQLFLHKIFGYRGVILFSWQAKVYDRDLAQSKSDSPPPKVSKKLKASEGKQTTAYTSSGKEVQGLSHIYYQVLIDERDWPYMRAQTESVTFLGSGDSSRSLYAVPGLDHVGHEDILPYSMTTEKDPIKHDLFDKFLAYDADREPNFIPKDTLQKWKKKNIQSLELSDVHRETTGNVRITVMPFYIGYRESNQSPVYWWRYSIRLENLGAETVTLRERHWRIFSLSGTLETVRGRGVVGTEPVLSKVSPAFQYASHVSLQAPSGHMWGTFKMERESGETFECRIPPFTLESQHDSNNNNNNNNNNTANNNDNNEGEEPESSVA